MASRNSTNQSSTSVSGEEPGIAPYCSTLSNAKHTVIKESELNNIGRDKTSTQIVFTINNDLSGLQGGGSRRASVTSPGRSKSDTGNRGKNDSGMKLGRRLARILKRLNMYRSSDAIGSAMEPESEGGNAEPKPAAASNDGARKGDGAEINSDAAAVPAMGTEKEDNNAKPEPVTKSSDIGSNEGDDAEVTYSDIVMVSANDTPLRDSTCTVLMRNPKASPASMYSRLMIMHELGYPLYMPEPDLGLKEYRKKGIRVGDVGRITPSGSFDFLFNACYPANHPINPEVLPDGFEVLSPIDVSFKPSLGPKTFLLSENVTQASNSTATYECPGPEGAVLVLPEGATQFEAENINHFKRHAARHAENWYKYMNGHKGREAPNGSLYFVTGCIKSRNWGIAAFYKGETKGNRVQFVINETPSLTRNAPPTYCWETSGRIVARMGPISQSITTAGDTELNQCTFLTGCRIMLQEGVWERLSSAISVQSPDSGSPTANWGRESNSNSNTGNGRNNATNNTSNQGGGPSANGSTTRSHKVQELEHAMVEVDFSTASPLHPSDSVNTSLLQANPRAMVAVTHDTEWVRALPKKFAADSLSPKIDELLQNISRSYEETVDDLGCVSLVVRQQQQGNVAPLEKQSDPEPVEKPGSFEGICPPQSSSAGQSPLLQAYSRVRQRFTTAAPRLTTERFRARSASYEDSIHSMIGIGDPCPLPSPNEPQSPIRRAYSKVRQRLTTSVQGLTRERYRAGAASDDSIHFRSTMDVEDSLHWLSEDRINSEFKPPSYVEGTHKVPDGSLPADSRRRAALNKGNKRTDNRPPQYLFGARI